MGLLDDFAGFIKTPEGQGLLSATFGGLVGAKRGQPINSLGRAGLAGLSGYSGAQDRETQAGQIAQQKKFQDQQMAGTQMQMDALKRQQALEQSMRDAAKAATITPERASAMSMGPMPDGSEPPTVQPGFNNEQYIQSLLGLGAPDKAIAFQQSIAKDNTPISVAPGASLIDKRTLKPIFTAPKEASVDPKIKQYEYAKQGGYKGSFEQFVTLGPTIMAAAAAPLRSAQVGNIEAENAYNLPAPRPAAQGVVVALPDGRSVTFKDKAAAKNFKLKAGIR